LTCHKQTHKQPILFHKTLPTVEGTIQIANLKSEINAVKDSLHTLQRIDEINKARMLRLTEDQMKLAMELDKTQEAVNRTMQLVNDHSEMLRSHDEAIRRIGELSKLIDNKLDAFMHAVEGQFLRTSIEDILRDKLN
jgi:paraquat-inducible protein B